MKRRPFLIAVIVSLFMLALYPQARAADISLGGGVLFNWWHPAWNNRKIVLYSPDLYKLPLSNWPSYPVNATYCYGPDVSIRFLKNINVSASFRYSRADMAGEGPSLIPNMGFQRISIAYDLYDTYARVGYFALEFLMPYAGLRVELLKNSIDFIQVGYSNPGPVFNITHAGMNGQMLKFTPEVGLHFAWPLSSFFTFMYEIACAFQSGSDTQDYSGMFSNKNPNFELPHIPTGRYYAVGCNTQLAFKFNIPKIDTSITAGGYYRLLGYIQSSRDRGLFNLNGSLDHTYGISCSVSYTFSTGKNRDKRPWIPRPSYPVH